MQSSLKRWAWLGLGVVGLAAAANAACGQAGTYEKTPTPGAPPPAATKPATTPAATAAATGAAATPSAASPTQAAATTATAGGGGEATTLTLVAKNTLFDKSELKAKAGAVTIEVDNQDGGIPHNLHVYRGKDNTGEDMGKTEIAAGPVKQTLKLQLTAGEYFFVCEVHPPTMFGKLEVE
jgi:plastocyanin